MLFYSSQRSTLETLSRVYVESCRYNCQSKWLRVFSDTHVGSNSLS